MSDLTIRPQEPRRPRFPFFHLHAVKEPTSCPSRARRRWKHQLPNSRREQDFISGCPAASLPFQKNADSGSESRSTSSALAGCSRGSLACQHPIFNFRPGPEPENLKPKISFQFQRLASVVTAFPRRRLSDGRVIWAAHWAVNSGKRQKRHFSN